jgi:tetratricopeptide (TPR) repeat protein
MTVKKTSNASLNLKELQRLRDLGRNYLQSNKIDQALQTYVALLDKFPDDIGSIIILGDSYLMAGDPSAAKDLYQVALDLEPTRNDIKHRVLLAENTVSSEPGIAGGFPPLHPQAVNRLIERLTGKPASFDEAQINRAAELLDKTIHSESPAKNVSEHLDEIDALLPAILELNIRQARSQGRADLAAELLDMQNRLVTKESAFPKSENSFETETGMLPRKIPAKRIVLIGEASQHSPYRQQVIAAALKQAGFVVEEDWEKLPVSWDGFI